MHIACTPCRDCGAPAAVVMDVGTWVSNIQGWCLVHWMMAQARVEARQRRREMAWLN